MDYQLAKELKEAGFPQKFKCGSWYYSHDGEVMGYITRVLGNMDDVHEDDGDIVKPTLSELIDACGDEFIALSKLGDLWWCATDGSPVRMMGIKGQTPEEAVARLWLALNQK